VSRRVARSRLKLPSTGLDSERSEWFRGHFDAAQEVVDLFQSSGVELAGKRIADIGCGDGIIDLGIVVKGKPAELVGYDLNEVDIARLLAEAKAEERIKALPAELSFVKSQPERIPADDDSFDIVVTWSAFEHVGDPEALLRDIRRVMKPDGVLFLQLWPFYNSEHGSHLWQWFPDGFAQFEHSDDAIAARIEADEVTDPGWGAMMLREYRALNRITLDELGSAIGRAGLRVSRIKLYTNDCIVPPSTAGTPLSALAIGGVQLLAVKA
jgi:SAM-dependent methyltransferase